MIKHLTLAFILLTTSFSYASDFVDNFLLLKNPSISRTPVPFGKCLTDQYWDEWLSEKSRRPRISMVQYVHEISAKKAGATLWFLLTGGKKGFLPRKANFQEAALMKNSFSNVARILSVVKPEESMDTKESILALSPRYERNHYQYLIKIEEEFRKKNKPAEIKERAFEVLKKSSVSVTVSDDKHNFKETLPLMISIKKSMESIQGQEEDHDENQQERSLLHSIEILCDFSENGCFEREEKTICPVF